MNITILLSGHGGTNTSAWQVALPENTLEAKKKFKAACHVQVPQGLRIHQKQYTKI